MSGAQQLILALSLLARFARGSFAPFELLDFNGKLHPEKLQLPGALKLALPAPAHERAPTPHIFVHCESDK